MPVHLQKDIGVRTRSDVKRPGETPKDVDTINRVRRILIATAIAFGVLSLPNTAHASTPEDTYLAALSRHGITGDPAALIDAGHDVCWALGQNWVVIGEALWKAQAEYAGQRIVGPAYGQAKHDAVNALCPDKSSWRD